VETRAANRQRKKRRMEYAIGDVIQDLGWFMVS